MPYYMIRPWLLAVALKDNNDIFLRNHVNWRKKLFHLHFSNELRKRSQMNGKGGWPLSITLYGYFCSSTPFSFDEIPKIKIESKSSKFTKKTSRKEREAVPKIIIVFATFQLRWGGGRQNPVCLDSFLGGEKINLTFFEFYCFEKLILCIHMI